MLAFEVVSDRLLATATSVSDCHSFPSSLISVKLILILPVALGYDISRYETAEKMKGFTVHQ